MQAANGVRSALRLGRRSGIALCALAASVVVTATAAVPATPSYVNATTIVHSQNLGQISNTIAWKLQSLASDPKLQGIVGIDVVDLATGQTVTSRHGYMPMMPASSFKILTAVVSLRLMPAATRFPTDVVALPDLPGLPNVTRVAIVGGGDSLLLSSDLAQLMPKIAQYVRDQGNDTVQINVDDSLFPAPTMAPGWQTKYELSEISPVRALERDGRRSWDTSVEVGRWFTTQIRATGIKAIYGGRASAPLESPTVASYAGHTLSQSLSYMLLYSNNDIAEHVSRLTTIAAGEQPNWQSWKEVAFSELHTLGINTSGMQIYDGSGLSRLDRLSPAALVVLVQRALDAKRHPELRSLLVNAPGDFPTAGMSGTLGRRFITPPTNCARGALRAKTGFLTGTSSLTGVARGIDGRTRMFAFIINSTPPKEKPELINKALDQMAATVVGCTLR